MNRKKISKKYITAQCIFASILIIIIVYMWFYDLTYSPLTVHDIQAESTLVIQSVVGDDIDEIHQLDRIETNHLVLELYSLTREDGHELRFYTIFARSLFFDRYQYLGYQEIELKDMPYELQFHGLPNKCTFSIMQDEIVLERIQLNATLFKYIYGIVIAIELVFWVRKSFIQYREENE